MSWHAVWWQKHDKSNQRWSEFTNPENQMCKYIYTMNKSFAPFSEEKKGFWQFLQMWSLYIFKDYEPPALRAFWLSGHINDIYD